MAPKTKTPTHGGTRTGAGRPPIKPGEDTRVTSVRLPISMADKLAALGGSEWIRDRIRRAKVPA